MQLVFAEHAATWAEALSTVAPTLLQKLGISQSSLALVSCRLPAPLAGELAGRLANQPTETALVVAVVQTMDELERLPGWGWQSTLAACRYGSSMAKAARRLLDQTRCGQSYAPRAFATRRSRLCQPNGRPHATATRNRREKPANANLQHDRARFCPRCLDTRVSEMS